MINCQRNKNMVNSNSFNFFSENIKGNNSCQNKTGLISKSKYDSIPSELLI